MFSTETMNNFFIGLQVTLYAMGGVFAVLILFYLIVKYMVKLSDRIEKRINKQA